MGKYIYDRRKGPDVWVKYVRAAGAIVWGFMFIILILLEKARPQTETFFDRLFHIDIRYYWDSSVIQVILFFSIIQFLFSMISLIINNKRHRRKSDRFSKSLIFTAIFSFLTILFSLKNIF